MYFGDKNPADVLSDTMWQMFQTFGQEANIPALKGYVYDFIKMATQKTSGQRKGDSKKEYLSFENDLHMTLWGIVIEACALVQSGLLEELKG